MDYIRKESYGENSFFPLVSYFFCLTSFLLFSLLIPCMTIWQRFIHIKLIAAGYLSLFSSLCVSVSDWWSNQFHYVPCDRNVAENVTFNIMKIDLKNNITVVAGNYISFEKYFNRKVNQCCRIAFLPDTPLWCIKFA